MNITPQTIDRLIELRSIIEQWVPGTVPEDSGFSEMHGICRNITYMTNYAISHTDVENFIAIWLVLNPANVEEVFANYKKYPEADSSYTQKETSCWQVDSAYPIGGCLEYAEDDLYSVGFFKQRRLSLLQFIIDTLSKEI